METSGDKYISFEKLEVYKLARALSKIAWSIYVSLDWQTKKVLGDQFIASTDSVGANIAEGYSRFHYLDKIKFMYNARASLSESMHWIDLFKERFLVVGETHFEYINLARKTEIKLNNFISAMYKSKNK